jgi:hypothetical protein
VVAEAPRRWAGLNEGEVGSNSSGGGSGEAEVEVVGGDLERGGGDEEVLERLRLREEEDAGEVGKGATRERA